MSFDAYVRFIEDDFLGRSRLDPRTDGRPDPRLTPVSSDDYSGYIDNTPPQPVVRETAVAGNLVNDFDFSRTSFPTAVAQPTTMPTPGATITPPDATWCSQS